MFLVMLLLGGFLLSVGAPGCHVQASCPVVQCTAAHVLNQLHSDYLWIACEM